MNEGKRENFEDEPYSVQLRNSSGAKQPSGEPKPVGQPGGFNRLYHTFGLGGMNLVKNKIWGFNNYPYRQDEYERWARAHRGEFHRLRKLDLILFLVII